MSSSPSASRWIRSTCRCAAVITVRRRSGGSLSADFSSRCSAIRTAVSGERTSWATVAVSAARHRSTCRTCSRASRSRSTWVAITQPTATAIGSSTTALETTSRGWWVTTSGAMYATAAGGAIARLAHRGKCSPNQANTSTKNGAVPPANPPNAQVENARIANAGTPSASGAYRCHRRHGSHHVTAATTRSATATATRSRQRSGWLPVPATASTPARANSSAAWRAAYSGPSPSSGLSPTSVTAPIPRAFAAARPRGTSLRPCPWPALPLRNAQLRRP
jgi:hypothetical protein